MEEMKKTDLPLSKGRPKPIKTEWNARYVLFTYFQGDIGTVVDEHFSRALSNIKRPRRLSPSSHPEDLSLRNESQGTSGYQQARDQKDNNTPSNHWYFSSPWIKPQPEASLTNGATPSSLVASGPKVMDQYPLFLPKIPTARPEELWPFSSSKSRSSEPGYFGAFPDRHLMLDPRPDGRCEHLLSFLQPDRYRNRHQEPITRENRSTVQVAGNAEWLLNLPSSPAYCKKVRTDTCRIDTHARIGKRICVSPSCGPASPGLVNERSRSPERRKDLYFY